MNQHDQNETNRRENTVTEYMTAGEIAEKTGVSIRTVQYYDQKGLLSPSAKGSRNLRLYTQKDLKRMYRILSYKMLNQPLDEIRKKLEQEEAPEQILELLQGQIRIEEERLSDQMRHYATMKNLESYLSRTPIHEWKDFVDLMNYFEKKWRLIWELNRGQEAIPPRWEEQYHNDAMRSYYELAEETIRLLRNGVPPDSEEAISIVRRFMELRDEDYQELLHVDPEFMRAENIDFSEFWKGIKSYLDQAHLHSASVPPGDDASAESQ